MGLGMSTVQRLLNAIRKLPAKERKRLVAALGSRPRGRAKGPRRPATTQGYARTLALAGAGHSEYTDVSSDKYKHLGEIHAPQP